MKLQLSGKQSPQGSRNCPQSTDLKETHHNKQMVTDLGINHGWLLNFSDLTISHYLHFWVMLVLCRCWSFQGWVSSKLCLPFIFIKGYRIPNLNAI